MYTSDTSWQVTSSILHVLISSTGCDHNKRLVYEHCKKSLLSLVLCVLDKNDHVLSNIREAMMVFHSSIYCSISKSTSLLSAPHGMYLP